MSDKYRKERREKDRRSKRWIDSPFDRDPPSFNPRPDHGRPPHASGDRRSHDRDHGPDRSADRGRPPSHRNDRDRPGRSNRKVDVYCFIRRDDADSPAIGVWNGKSTRSNPATGKEEERYTWIRRDRVDIKEHGGTGRSAGRSVITIVEWLAEDWEFERA